MWDTKCGFGSVTIPLLNMEVTVQNMEKTKREESAAWSLAQVSNKVQSCILPEVIYIVILSTLDTKGCRQMTSKWARRGMRRGNIKYSSGGAILNTQNNNMRGGGKTKYSKKGIVWRSRGKASSGKRVIKLLCPNRLSVNINFDRICLSINSLSTFSKGPEKIM